MRCLLAAIITFFGAAASAQSPASSNPTVPTNLPKTLEEEPIELDSVMMESTFMIEGPALGGGSSFGTVFIIARPRPNVIPVQGIAVLVTAAHVLDGIQGDMATLHLRQRVDDKTNRWVQIPFQIQIRSNNQPLWARNPAADVAAMNVTLPDFVVKQIKPITPLMFVDDEKLLEYKVNPGDEVRCLGYPLGVQSNEAGFPVLRSGKIASYPLTPTAQTKTFLVDLRIFKGNSGGPVFFVENNRVVPGML
jgi:S1-C subfamily serine protease